jgi:hypothetical protein
MKLVQILLPVTRTPGTNTTFEKVMQELTEKFGGVTAHLNSPAEGLWKDQGEQDRDRVVTIEVMIEDFDSHWWTDYRKALEQAFDQKEIVVRVLAIVKV